MRVVLANGCFDPPHYGHLLHLKQAREYGDYLIVSVTDDHGVRNEKGDTRPVLNQNRRAEFLTSLKCVDQTIVVPGVLWALATIRPQIFVKGSDYIHTMGKEVREYCKRHGIEMRFTDTEKWSATALISELRGR